MHSQSFKNTRPLITKKKVHQRENLHNSDIFDVSLKNKVENIIF